MLESVIYILFIMHYVGIENLTLMITGILKCKCCKYFFFIRTCQSEKKVSYEMLWTLKAEYVLCMIGDCSQTIVRGVWCKKIQCRKFSGCAFGLQKFSGCAFGLQKFSGPPFGLQKFSGSPFSPGKQPPENHIDSIFNVRTSMIIFQGLPWQGWRWVSKGRGLLDPLDV